MKIARLTLLCIGVLCTNSLFAQSDVSAPNASARIRAFGQNGINIKMYTNAVCKKHYDKKIVVSGSFRQSLGSLFGVAKNQTIGIPQTDTTRQIDRMRMLGSKPFYREYTIEAGKPITIEGGFQSAATPPPRKGGTYLTGYYCSKKPTGTFIPQPGKDYEVAMYVGHYCTLVINQVQSNGQLTPVPVQRAPESCDVGSKP